MLSTWRGPLILVVAALVVFGALYAWEHAISPRSENAAYSSTGLPNTYTNSTYDYSVSYPGGYESKELEPEFTEIGQQSGGNFSEAADIATLHATVQDPIPSFSDFVKLSAQLACSTSSSPCGQVATSSTFTAGSGISGTELYFDSGSGTRGPYFAFDITNNVPGASYATLLIYPPPQLAASNADLSLLQQIASSLQVAFK